MTGTRTRGATVTRYATEHTGMSAQVEAGRRVAGRIRHAFKQTWTATAETVNPVGWLLLATAIGGIIAAVDWGCAEASFVGLAAAILLIISVPFLLGRHSYDVSLEFNRDRVVA